MSRRSWLLFGAMCVIWGIPYLLIKVSVRELSPATLVFARTSLGALVLLPLALQRRSFGPVLARWRPLVLFTVVEMAIPWLLLSDAETKLSSSLAGLLVAAVPLAGALIAWVLKTGESPDRTAYVGMIVGFVGVGALLGLDVSQTDLRAVLQVGVVVVGYALGPVILRRYLSDLPSVGVVASSLLLTALIYLPAAVVDRPRALSGEVVASVVTLGVVCTALAFVLFFALISDIGAIRATVITYVNPAVAVLLGVGLLGEHFTVGMGVGFPLIILGSVLAARCRPSVGEAGVDGVGGVAGVGAVGGVGGVAGVGAVAGVGGVAGVEVERAATEWEGDVA